MWRLARLPNQPGGGEGGDQGVLNIESGRHQHVEEVPDVEVDAAGEQDDCDECEDDHRRGDQLVTRAITPHHNFSALLFYVFALFII